MRVLCAIINHVKSHAIALALILQNRYESDLSNEVLFILTDQEDAKMLEVKVEYRNNGLMCDACYAKNMSHVPDLTLKILTFFNHFHHS